MKSMVCLSLSAALRVDCSCSRIDIQEYLLLKGVEAVAIHGSKSRLDFLHIAITSNTSVQPRRSDNMPSSPSNLVQRT